MDRHCRCWARVPHVSCVRELISLDPFWHRNEEIQVSRNQVVDASASRTSLFFPLLRPGTTTAPENTLPVFCFDTAVAGASGPRCCDGNGHSHSLFVHATQRLAHRFDKGDSPLASSADKYLPTWGSFSLRPQFSVVDLLVARYLEGLFLTACPLPGRPTPLSDAAQCPDRRRVDRPAGDHGDRRAIPGRCGGNGKWHNVHDLRVVVHRFVGRRGPHGGVGGALCLGFDAGCGP